MNESSELLLDLMILRATETLTQSQALQLDTLLLTLDEAQAEKLETQLEAALAAAANASALRGATPGDSAAAMPEALHQRLEADADRFFGKTSGLLDRDQAARAGRRTGSGDGQPAPEAASRARAGGPVSRGAPPRPGDRQRSRFSAVWASGGWAFAALLLAVLWFGGPRTPAEPTPKMARETLLAAADTVVLSWASPAGGVYSGVEGDISWSDSRQKGFLRLRGLPANDPALTQYQLWIVDPQRADEPVDGGVFDVPAGVQELILPVQARLPVREPLAFALTLEKPGGVVVSSAPRLLIAQRG